MTTRILIAEPAGYSEAARAILREEAEVVEEPVAQDELAARVRGFDVLIVRLGLRVSADVLAAGDRLRAVVTATTGLDHVDTAAAAERGIAVLSLAGETKFLGSIPATAEHTWALLLALVRRIPWAFDSVRRGEWDRDRFRGRDLAGRRLGILGAGRIGARVAGYGQAFGMQVGAFDREARELPGVSLFESAEALAAWSEFLTIHVPLTEQTRGLVNADLLQRLPRGALLVSTSRGAVLNEAAVVAALQTGQLAGVAADVLADEQDPALRAASPLLTYARAHDTVLLTPHLGGATLDSMQRTEVFMAEKLRAFLSVREHVR